VLEHGSRLIKTNITGGWPQRYLHGLRDGGGDDIAAVFIDIAILLKKCCQYARTQRVQFYAGETADMEREIFVQHGLVSVPFPQCTLLYNRFGFSLASSTMRCKL